MATRLTIDLELDEDADAFRAGPLADALRASLPTLVVNVSIAGAVHSLEIVDVHDITVQESGR